MSDLKQVYNNFLHKSPLWVAFAFLICVSVIWWLIGKKIKNRSVWNNINIFLLISDILLILWFTLLSRIGTAIGGDRIVWLPFQKESLSIPIIWTWKAVLDNVLLFMPLGMAMSQLFKGKRKYLFVGFVLSLLIEVLQLALHLGVFETEDVICNTCGYLISWLVTFVFDGFCAHKSAVGQTVG